MAVVVSNPRISSFRGDRKPWMLKDFLLDDLGSCSSSGFRSFPRRQCCVAVRNLIEMEVRGRNSTGSNSRRLVNIRSKSTASSASAKSRISNAIRRASRAVITAVKLLPFNSPAPTVSAKKKKKTLLRRSFSNNPFRKSLRKKKDFVGDDRSGECEIERWISSGAAAAEKYQPSELSNVTTTSTVITVTSASTASSTRSGSWSEFESEFTQARSSVDENGVVEAPSKKKWSSDVEKEQLSPVSVLSFPDEDEELESINHSEGTKKKLLQKLRRFDSFSQVGKVNLEHLLSLATNDSDSDTDTDLPSRSFHSPLHAIKEEETKEEAAKRLMSLIKSKTTSSNQIKINEDNLLLGFFHDGLAKATQKNQKLVEEALLIQAKDWLCGESHDEVSTGWKVKEKRKVYMKDMEEGGEWVRTNFHETQKEEVSAQMEGEVFGTLVEELVGEFTNLELLNLLLM